MKSKLSTAASRLRALMILGLGTASLGCDPSAGTDPATSATSAAPVQTTESNAPAREIASGLPHLDEVRFLWETHCGTCHLPEATDERSPPAALGIFDLNNAAFTDSLSDPRLVEARRRFEEQNPEPADLAAIDAWLLKEFAHRDAHPKRYSLAFRGDPAADAVVTPDEGCVGRDCLKGRWGPPLK